MPNTITPVPEWATTLQVPADGENADSASLELPVQVLADREALLLETRKMIGPLPRSVYCINGTDLKIDPIRGIMVTASSVWKYVDISSVATVTVAAKEGGGNFVVGTHMYVYVYYNAGSPAYQISATAPDAYMLWKTGSTDYAYICSFIAPSATGIPLFKMRRGEYTFLKQSAVTNPINLLINAAAPVAGPTNISCAGVMPPHARWLDLFVSVTNVNAANVAEIVLYDTDAGGVGGIRYTFDAGKLAGAGISGFAQGPVCLTVDSSQRFTYTATGTMADITLTILATGFRE